MENDSLVAGLVVGLFILFTLVLPILYFTIAQKLLAIPFKIERRGLSRMFWAGTLCFSVSLAIPLGLSVCPLIGTIFGLILVFPIGAHLCASLHSISVSSGLLFFFCANLLYSIFWILSIYIAVLAIGGLPEALELINQYIDLSALWEKIANLFSQAKAKV